MAEGISLKEIGEWHRLGHDLALVDPERFRRYLAAVRAAVGIYLADDPADAFASLYPQIASPAKKPVHRYPQRRRRR